MRQVHAREMPVRLATITLTGLPTGRAMEAVFAINVVANRYCNTGSRSLVAIEWITGVRD
jgi:hypothetical protein